MKPQVILTTAFLAVSSSLVSGQTVYIDEGFESYDSLTGTNPLSANWTNAVDQIALNTSGGNPGQSVTPTDFNSDQAVWTGSTFDLLPTATENIVFRADFFDPGSEDIRRTVTLGGPGGSGTLEMGLYNVSGGLNNYGIRVLGSSFYDNSNWSEFSGASRTSGWHRFEAVLSTTELTATLDIGSDGSIESTLTFSGDAGTVGLTTVDFGPPANDTVGSNPQIDNIYLAQVPEPEAFALGLGVLALALVVLRRSAFRRRRS